MVLDPTIAVTLRLFLSLLFVTSALHKMRSSPDRGRTVWTGSNARRT